MFRVLKQIHMSKNLEIEGPSVTCEAAKVSHIRKGSKELTLEINQLTGNAATYLDTRTGEQRLSGETTTVYRAAKKIMQEEAKNSPTGGIDYTLETGFPRMRDWAAGPGGEIFHWDCLYRTVDDPEIIRAHVVIRPKSGGTEKP